MPAAKNALTKEGDRRAEPCIEARISTSEMPARIIFEAVQR